MTTSSPQSFCPNCDYDLTEFQIENEVAVCSECGMEVTPTLKITVYTYKQLHRDLAKKLLLPIAVPLLAMSVLSYFIYQITVVGIILIFVYPFTGLYCLCVCCKEINAQNKLSIKTIPEKHVLLWVLLYNFICILSYYALYRVTLAQIYSMI